MELVAIGVTVDFLQGRHSLGIGATVVEALGAVVVDFGKLLAGGAGRPVLQALDNKVTESCVHEKFF